MDQLIKQLPRVLQNEIWEYVRGDRTYWKRQFKPILKIVTYINRAWACVHTSKISHPEQTSIQIGNVQVTLTISRAVWTVSVCEPSGLWPNWRNKQVISSCFDDACRVFFRQVEIEVLTQLLIKT